MFRKHGVSDPTSTADAKPVTAVARPNPINPYTKTSVPIEIKPKNSPKRPTAPPFFFSPCDAAMAKERMEIHKQLEVIHLQEEADVERESDVECAGVGASDDERDAMIFKFA